MSTENKKYVWQMIKEAITDLGGKSSNTDIRDWILKRYPGTNFNTIQCQIIVCTVNHTSRIYYPENHRPRIANSQYDFLYRPERSKVELYDPSVHGLWEIYEDDNGMLGVRQTTDGNAKNTYDVELNDIPEKLPVSGFAQEFHLRDFLAKNLNVIEEGLQLYSDDNDNDGVEYPTGIGRIDILAVDNKGDFVVVELKVEKCPDSASGQIMRGRVWDELNDYREGRYYLPKETEKLSTLECFTRESSAQTFFIPGYYDKDDKAFQDTLNKMLDNTMVLFSYLETDPQVDASMMKKIVYNIEAYFQNNIVTAKRLHPKWIGDHGKGYSLEKQYNYIVEIIYENSNIMNALDEKILLGK